MCQVVLFWGPPWSCVESLFLIFAGSLKLFRPSASDIRSHWGAPEARRFGFFWVEGLNVGARSQPQEFEYHNIPLVVLGTFALWFGWRPR